MNRHDFIRLAVAGFGTMLASGAAINFLSNKNTPEANVPAAEAAQQPTPNGKQRIVVITSSPHRNGMTSVLAEQFIKGTEAKGHSVFRFDAAFHNIHGCLVCDACGMNGLCVQKEDIENDLIMRLVNADLIRSSRPFIIGTSARNSRPALIDFTHAQDVSAASRAFCSQQQAATFPGLWTATLSGYMRWQSRGTLLATNCKTRKDILKTTYPQAAYDLGHSL